VTAWYCAACPNCRSSSARNGDPGGNEFCVRSTSTMTDWA
jgi:hypothetical protein